MERPNLLGQNGYQAWVQNVAYGPSNELESMQIASPNLGTTKTETRKYNNRLQLANLKVANGSNTTLMNLAYTYPNGWNNGQASGVSDAVSGEQIVYQRDDLAGSTGGLCTSPAHPGVLMVERLWC